MDVPSLSGPKTVALALLAAAAIPVGSAMAQSTTFVIDGTEGASTYSITTNGITMNFFDPAENDTGNFAFGLDSADGDSGTGELNLSSSDTGFVTSFDLSFSSAVKVVSYTVGAIDTSVDSSYRLSAAPSETFSLSGPDSATSAGNDLSTTGSHDVVGTFIIGADQTGTFDTGDSIPNNMVISLESITVEDVPEPGTWTLLGLGGVVAFFMRRFRRERTAG